MNRRNNPRGFGAGQIPRLSSVKTIAICWSSGRTADLFFVPLGLSLQVLLNEFFSEIENIIRT